MFKRLLSLNFSFVIQVTNYPIIFAMLLQPHLLEISTNIMFLWILDFCIHVVNYTSNAHPRILSPKIPTSSIDLTVWYPTPFTSHSPSFSLKLHGFFCLWQLWCRALYKLFTSWAQVTVLKTPLGAKSYTQNYFLSPAVSALVSSAE